MFVFNRSRSYVRKTADRTTISLFILSQSKPNVQKPAKVVYKKCLQLKFEPKSLQSNDHVQAPPWSDMRDHANWVRAV
jgi:hypothetical protein